MSELGYSRDLPKKEHMTQDANNFDWNDFLDGCVARVTGLPNTWFNTPYRTKPEALRVAFGDQWDIKQVSVRADWKLPGYLLTDTTLGDRIMTVFPDARWYPTQNADPNHEPTRRGKSRDLRNALKDVVAYAVWASSLPALVGRYASRVQAGNPQAYAYIPALFEVWLTERGILGEDADGLRVLTGLGGYEFTALLMAQRDEEIAALT